MEVKWHKVDEKPQYDENDYFKNIVLVCGENSVGKSMSSCIIVDKDATIYCPLNKIEYEWGVCQFTHWAYCYEIYPKD